MDFKKSYNRSQYLNFFRNQLLPEDFEEYDEKVEIGFQPQFIQKIVKIGEVRSLETNIYEIKHRSENDPRVSLSRDSFRLLAQYGAKKALILFVSQSSLNYRLSLVTIDLKWDEGRRVKKEYSNPRRYSFFLGPDTKTHTPEEYLITKGRIKDLNDLQNRFSVEVVTKEFFNELSNWYFWALKNIECPKDAKKEQNGKNIFTIRLITRLIFIWFMKHKGLIPEDLFNNEYLKKILKDLSQSETTYYKAILQNLFFATLNTPIKDRDFRTDKSYQGKNKDFMNHKVYRYHKLFTNPEDMKLIFNNIPFLNGGLFECLDRIEDKGEYIRIDGFSGREDSQANVPDFLFFSGEHLEDLNKDYGTKGKKYKVRGIINLLQTYNFTIDESTPVDVEIALDPELLGRVFENLLASYNPGTATTARKATGSYYTPREIVDYMVTQSLKEYFKTKLSERDCHCDPSASCHCEPSVSCHSERSEESHNDQGRLRETIPQTIELDKKLNELLSYDSDENPFNEKETDTLINSVNNLKIIDPAVGSGAFPMGILQKLVLILSKLDSHAEDIFKKNELDYGRKLYLIQNCIYGVDIQPIAIQIAKLRFFISLLVDEKIDKRQENYGIEPLPNLELKFVSANSLIGLNLKGQLGLNDLRLPKLEEDLKRVREIYFRTSDMNRKKKLRKEDKKIRNEISSLLKQSRFLAGDTKKISDWNPYNSNKSADWFDPEWMFGIKDGFDIVIANPPYVSFGLRDVGKVKGNWADYMRIHYPNSAEYKLSIYAIFMDKGIQLLKNNGVIVYITPDSFLLGRYFSKLRKYILRNCLINNILMFEKDFWKSGVIGRPVIISFIKTPDEAKKLHNKVAVYLYFDMNSFNNNVSISNSYEQSHFENLKYNKFRLYFSTRAEKYVLHLDTNSIPLGNIARITTGVRSKIGQKNIIDKIQKKPNWEKGIISGSQVLPYFVNWEGDFINIDKKILWAGGWNPNIVENPKLMIRQTGDTLIVGIDNRGLYHLNNVHSLKIIENKISLEYLCAVLNSKLMNRYYKLISLESGRTMAQTDIETLETLPIKIPKNNEQKIIIDLVRKIASSRDNEECTRMEETEKLIQDIYELPEDLRKYISEDILY